MYKRILIIGAGGSGKTTLGKKISKILKIKSKSIDELRYSKDFKIRFSEEKSINNLNNFLKQKSWILDGIYSPDYINPAIKKSDIIIVINSSRLKLIYRIIKREISIRKKYKDKPLKDIIKLIYWSQKYKKHNETAHLTLAKKLKKELIFLKDYKDIEKFLKSISK